MTEDIHAGNLSADQRWDAWVAHGVVQDRQMKTRALIAFPVIAALVVLALFLVR